jgi:RNA polymerase sigma-70 factor (ECF subfamily)
MAETERRQLTDEARARAERDLSLINAYRSGRIDAFEDLVRAYESTVARILAQLNVAAADVEDLAQDVFLRVYRNLHRFRSQSSFYTWLYRITVNVFFDHSKKRKRADQRLNRLQNAMIDASAPVPEMHDPYRATLDSMLHDALSSAISRLPEAFREVVAMREIDDLSYEEIALATGISIGTVRSRLSRARSRLKETIGPVLTGAAA